MVGNSEMKCSEHKKERKLCVNYAISYVKVFVVEGGGERAYKKKNLLWNNIIIARNDIL